MNIIIRRIFREGEGGDEWMGGWVDVKQDTQESSNFSR